MIPPFAVTFLGTGTSTGVPMIGCPCRVCRSDDPRDKRMRPSLWVRGPEGALLVDCGPEMRVQTLRAGVETIDAALLTHSHADHIYGLDDLRQFNFRLGRAIPVLADDDTLARLRVVFDYCFTDTQAGGGKPRLDLVPIRPGEPFRAAGLEILPVRVLHGRMPVLAFVFEKTFAYCTDVSFLPDAARDAFRGVDTLVLGTVRTEPPPHSTHFILPEALDEIARIGPRRAYLTHLSHHFHHADVSATLPDGVFLAHDDLTLRFGAG